MKFLIVDDSRAMQTIVHKAMVTSGYSDHDYDYAFNGKEALDKIHRSKPDIVLCDWHMPEMNGLELLKKINEEHIDVKIGLVTTERFQERIKEARDAGAMFVVSKPFTAETLCQAVEEVLSSDDSTTAIENKSSDIVLPTQKSIKKIMSSLTNHIVSLKATDDFSLTPDKFPCIVCLYQNAKTGTVVAVSVLDLHAACYLGASVHSVSSKEVAIAIQNQIVPKDFFDASKLFLELLSAQITNKDDSIDISCKGIHMVNEKMEKFKALIQKNSSGSNSYIASIDGHGSGNLFVLMQ